MQKITCPHEIRPKKNCRECKRESQKRCYAKHREQYVKERREYNQTHRLELRRKCKEYYQTHKEQCRESMRKYRQTHKEEYKEYFSKYHQRHKKQRRESTLTLKNGKIIRGLHKRYPEDGRCMLGELCLCKKLKYKYNRIVWHHWDDNHPEWGLWICWSCHWIMEQVEKMGDEKFIQHTRKITVKYYDLKARIQPYIQ